MTASHDQALSIGQGVIWKHRPRGGYGFEVRIKAVVLRINRVTVCIRFVTDTGRVIERNVRREHLTARRP